MQQLECERMFVAVMETGSFAKAASHLGTESAQASKLISRLETDLGVRLLNRTTCSLSPTEVGQAYLERIKLLHEELDVSSHVSISSGVVSVTGSDCANSSCCLPSSPRRTLSKTRTGGLSATGGQIAAIKPGDSSSAHFFPTLAEIAPIETPTLPASYL